MSNRRIVKIVIKADRPKGFGFKIQDENGNLLVTMVNNEGAAFSSGLRYGDIIFSVNGEKIEFDANCFVRKMNDMCGEIQLQVYREDIPLPRSCSNGSDGLDQISSNSCEKLGTSTSSIDLNHSVSSLRNHQILEDNYVPEEHINNYLQPMFQSADDNGQLPQNQITRKQAYRKPMSDLSLLDQPRVNVKRATKSSSFINPEPSYRINRRGKARASDTAPTIVNAPGQGTRRSIAPPVVSQTPMEPQNVALNYSSPPAIVPLVNMDASASPVAEKMTTSSLLSLSETFQIETQVKILSFKEKIKKIGWVNFRIESDKLGALFHSLDLSETPMTSNSTAIDPFYSGLDVYMRHWSSNNTMSKFFLPIGNPPYDNNIEITSNGDSIIVKYAEHDVDFLINYSRLSDDRTNVLFTILRSEVPEERQTQVKAKRVQAIQDNVKTEPRKARSQKLGTELPRDSLLSHLPQTKLIENVPLVVVICISIIEKVALRKEGIFRKSGNEATRKKLENMVLNQSPETWSESEDWSNVNTVASLLKSVLRNYSLIDRDTAIKLSMINVNSEVNEEQNYMDMVYHLRQHLCRMDTRLDQISKDRYPSEVRCRLETFKYLLRHLNTVSRQMVFNKMGPDNLATCFSPTIIEDIPCDDDEVEYQASKKGDADKNLKQMVAFWITNANVICDLLDEDDDQQRIDKLGRFSALRDKLMSLEEVEEEEEIDDGEMETIIRDLVESCTSQAVIVSSDSGSVNMTDGAVLGKTKTQTSKKKDTPTRRGSAMTVSPSQPRKTVAGAGDIDAGVFTRQANVGFPKKTSVDAWASRSLRKKKEPQLPEKKELSLTSMRLSGIDTSKKVPVIVEVCVSIIEEYGLDVDGVYRVSGKRHDINVLEGLVVANNYNNCTDEPHLAMWANMHTVAGLLKTILKRFCLIRKETWVHMFSQFSDKIEPCDVRKVLLAAAYHLRHEKKPKRHDRVIIPDLAAKDCEDDIRSATLRYVLRHLKKVTQHELNNRMTSNALAICFMPVLMEEDSTGDVMAISNKGIQITEQLINHCDWIFRWDDRPWEDIFGKEMTDSLDRYLDGVKTSVSGSEISRLSSDERPDHIIDCDKVQRILEKSFAKSYIVAQNRFTLRRHSDETDTGNRKTEYRQSKLYDDSQLPDNMTLNRTNENDIFDI